MATVEGNGYLKWWQFGIGVIILAVGLAATFTKAEGRIENNVMEIRRNTVGIMECRQEIKDSYAEISDEVDDIGEIKMNLKVMMEHFDLKYIEK